jgi:adenylyltransferase/sulfurtransferase
MDAAERQRYSRQILFPGIGERGQEALLRSHAAVVGCGALGSFHVSALARAGVGTLTIVDRDYVEPSGMSRASIPAFTRPAWWPTSFWTAPTTLKRAT